MKRYLIIFLLTFVSVYSQDDYFNNDGTLTDNAKRKILVEGFKKNQTDDIQYDSEDNYFIIITKNELEIKNYEPKEIQQKALIYCFSQLLNTLTSLKKNGYDLFTNMAFKGIIFKTNTISNDKTRRYHFKFNFEELKKMPEYMDFDELTNYVINQNGSKNIIYIKNER